MFKLQIKIQLEFLLYMLIKSLESLSSSDGLASGEEVVSMIELSECSCESSRISSTKGNTVFLSMLSSRAWANIVNKGSDF